MHLSGTDMRRRTQTIESSHTDTDEEALIGGGTRIKGHTKRTCTCCRQHSSGRGWILRILYAGLAVLFLCTVGMFVWWRIIRYEVAQLSDISSSGECPIQPPLSHPFAWSPRPFRKPIESDSQYLVTEEIYVQIGDPHEGLFFTCPEGSHIAIRSAEWGTSCGLDLTHLTPSPSPWNLHELQRTMAALTDIHSPEANAVYDAVEQVFKHAPSHCRVDQFVQYTQACNGARGCCVHPFKGDIQPTPCEGRAIHTTVTYRCMKKTWYGRETLEEEPFTGGSTNSTTAVGPLIGYMDWQGTQTQPSPRLAWFQRADEKAHDATKWMEGPSVSSSNTESGVEITPIATSIPTRPKRQCVLGIALYGPNYRSPSHGSGLHNQLLTFASLAVVALHTGCDLAVDGFHPDFNRMEQIPISELLNLDELHKKMDEIVNSKDPLDESIRYVLPAPLKVNITTKAEIFSPDVPRPLRIPKIYDVAQFDPQLFKPWFQVTSCTPCSPVEFWLISALGRPKNVNDGRTPAEYVRWVTLLRNHPNPGFIQIGRIWDLLMSSTGWKKLQVEIEQALPFSQKFISAKQALQSAMGLHEGRYAVIHLRMEDDLKCSCPTMR